MINEVTATIKEVSATIKHWYLWLISGILFIVVGAVVFSTPLESYVALSILFAVSFFVSGLMDSILAIQNRKTLSNWGWTLAMGIMNILLGGWLMTNLIDAIIILPFVVGFTLLFRSIMGIGLSVDLQQLGSSEWGWALALSILGIFFSFTLIANPLLAGATIVLWTGLAFITLGVYGIFFSFRLRKINKQITKVKDAISL